MSGTGAADGLGDFREYTSGSDATTWAAPNLADWVQVIGSGNAVVTTEAGNNRTITCDASEPAASMRCKIKALVSMTATRVRIGVGKPPPIVVPASAVPATTSAVGGVELSVAPAVAATPIAVGNNDVRVGQIEVWVPLNATDGSFAEASVWVPGVASTITGASLSSSSAITQSDTNYLTFTLGIRDGAGGSASTVASKTTQTTGGGAFAAFQALSLGSVGNATTTSTSQITFKAVKTSSGQAVTNGALLRITYTTP